MTEQPRSFKWMHLVLLSLSFGCMGRSQRVMEYRVPQPYEGWVIVLYEVEGCPELTSQDGVTIVDIDQRGMACTSSKHPGVRLTAGQDTYVRVGPNGRAPLVIGTRGAGGDVWWMHSGVCERVGVQRRIYGAFFIGAESTLPSREVDVCTGDR